MSYEEISETYRREIQLAYPRIEESAKKFGGIVKKTRRYPLQRVFDVSTKNRIVLHLIFLAEKRDQWSHPKLCIYSTFHKSGLHAISMNGPDGVAYIYLPHFFERYRERIIKDCEMSSETLIKEHMKRNKDTMWHINSDVFSASYQKYEHDVIPQLAARIEEGCVFLEKLNKKLLIVKTILSDDMLGDDQSASFGQLEMMRSRYSTMSK